MPDHLTVTITESADGDELIVESDIEASTLSAVCAMTGALLRCVKRLHDEAHYLERIKN